MVVVVLAVRRGRGRARAVCGLWLEVIVVFAGLVVARLAGCAVRAAAAAGCGQAPAGPAANPGLPATPRGVCKYRRLPAGL